MSLEVQLPQLDYSCEGQSVLICARSSLVHLVVEALFLGPQLPFLVVQKFEDPAGRGGWRGRDDFCARRMSKSWVVALQLPVGRHGWARIWSQKELGVSLWHLRWMEAGSGTSVTMFGGCSMPSSINRIPAGAEMLLATAVGCVLCHTWQMKAVSGTSSTILRPWLWLRLGLAPDVFFRWRPARSHGKIPRLCSHLAAWPWLEAGVINHNPCSLSL